MSPDRLADALAALRAAGTGAGAEGNDVDDEAAQFVAGISQSEPGARERWAEVFGRPASSFDVAVGRGRSWQTQPTALLRRLLDEGRADDAAAYAHALVDLASAAATMGEPSIEGMNAAGFAASAQLRAVTPGGALFVPAALRALVDVASTGPGGSGTPPTVALSGTATVASSGPSAPAATPAEPQPTLDELFAKLDGLVGLVAVKDEIHHQAELLRVDRLRTEHGLKTPGVNRHLVFVGNPGTGKTTVARLVAGIYRALGVLPRGQLVETDRSGLVAGYVGQTALKTSDVVKSALGGVLFVDEAYALASDDFGSEAINTLVKAMEDHRDDLVLIVAGYPDEMEVFIRSNPGLSSRFRTTITFADYSDDELVAIFTSMCKDADFTPAPACTTRLRARLQETVRDRGFGNARFVRNLFEAAVVRQAWRLRDVPLPTVEQLRRLEADDLPAPTLASPQRTVT
jgi:AAA lid domain/ATPase family associated with various cellular activities (AAA)